MFDAASVGNPHDLILKLLRSCNNRISKVQDKDINTTGRSQNMFCFSGCPRGLPDSAGAEVRQRQR